MGLRKSTTDTRLCNGQRFEIAPAQKHGSSSVQFDQARGIAVASVAHVYAEVTS
jgi:hypothetical protein